MGRRRGRAAAAGLLPAYVAEHLPGLAHAVDTWTRLAARHPDPVLDHAEAALADLAGGRQRENWWRFHATAVAALAPLRPLRVLTLLERYGPDSLPSALVRSLGPLIETDAERVVAWITSPHRVERRYEPLPPPGVLSRLVKAEPVSLPLLGRHWLRRDRHFAALLKAMAPAGRPAFLDAVTAAGARREPALAVLELLPGGRHGQQARPAGGMACAAAGTAQARAARRTSRGAPDDDSAGVSAAAPPAASGRGPRACPAPHPEVPPGPRPLA
ncbi:hypothetical protein ACISU4_32330 [Streptomyces wuyuanensis]|uniref:hypothetical protein n=1 Tax=Streptomyces wuyuanensis TaxID=1196353 RepID=UPI003819DFD2